MFILSFSSSHQLQKYIAHSKNSTNTEFAERNKKWFYE